MLPSGSVTEMEFFEGVTEMPRRLSVAAVCLRLSTWKKVWARSERRRTRSAIQRGEVFRGELIVALPTSWEICSWISGFLPR